MGYAASSTQIAVLADPDLIPSRHALYVRGEDISWADWNAHSEYSLSEHTVGTGRTRAIDVGKFYDEVIDGLLCLHGLPALVTL